MFYLVTAFEIFLAFKFSLTLFAFQFIFLFVLQFIKTVFFPWKPFPFDYYITYIRNDVSCIFHYYSTVFLAKTNSHFCVSRWMTYFSIVMITGIVWAFSFPFTVILSLVQPSFYLHNPFSDYKLHQHFSHHNTILLPLLWTQHLF